MTLNEVCDFQNGGTPSKAVERYFTGNIPWITGADLVGPIAQNARSFITEEAITSSATNKVPAGTVLLVTRTSVGKVAIAGKELCFSQDITALLPDSAKLDAGYLVHFLRTKEDHFSRYARGATIKGITRQVVADLVIPLPPLEEQRRIAAILDQAETLRTQRRTALALLDSLTQSLFLDMFGDPAKNTLGLPTKQLGELGGWHSGGTPPRSKSHYFEGDIPWFSSGELEPMYVSDSVEHISDAALKETATKLVPAGSLMMGMYDTAALKTSIALNDCSCNQAIAFSKLDPTLADTAYVYYAIVVGREHFRRLQRGVRQKNLNLSMVREIRIPHPPLPLQQTFATRIASIEALKATHRRALAALDALFASLQQRAFLGELTSSPEVQAANTRTTAQNFEELLQLEADQALEALIYVARRMPDGDLYKTHKALYFADRHHLEFRGRLIYNETYCALPHGPVPQAAYDATRVLGGERLLSDLDNDALRAALRRSGNTLTTTRDADFNKLGPEARESLEWAIRYCRDMSFVQTKTASHDRAYERTPENEPIPLQYIIETLPPEARQRHWGR